MAKNNDNQTLAVDMGVATKATAVGVQLGIPVLQWGPPGVGKTTSIKMIGDQLGVHLETVIASLRAPEDFLGFPIVKEGAMHYAPAAFVMRLMKAGGGICFLDEISTCQPAVQAAMLRMVNEGIVGEEVLENVSFVAAANPAHQAAGGWTLAAPLGNRFIHLHVKLNVAYLTRGMVSGFDANANLPLVPADWRKQVPQANNLISGYLDANPAKALVEPDNADAGQYAWPSPRSWYALAAPILAASFATRMDDEVRNVLICGAVGDSYGGEFIEWFGKLDLPKPADLLSGKVKFTYERNRQDKMFVVLNSVSHYVTENMTPDNWAKAWGLYENAMSQGGQEVVAAAARSLAVAGRHHTPKMPLPLKAIGALIPILRAAGLMTD